ncbi:MAG: hypothetical protein ACRCYO_13555 [Bacteroidia bacterium]
MNLLKSLEPWAKHLDAFAKGFGISDRNALTELCNIWDQFKVIPANAAIIYQRVMIAPPTDKGCQSCVEEALRSLVNWRKKLEAEQSVSADSDQPTKKAKVTEPKKDAGLKASETLNADTTKAETDKADTTVEEPVPNTGALTEPTIADKLGALKMPALKKIAQHIGVTYAKTTTKPSLIEMIKGKVTEGIEIPEELFTA